MKIKVQDLTGAALDWAVTQAHFIQSTARSLIRSEVKPYSTDWSQGGPLIEREKIEWQWIPTPNKAHQYGARKPSLGGLNRTFCINGPTLLVAAMRCFVASKLGDEVDVPDELMED